MDFNELKTKIEKAILNRMAELEQCKTAVVENDRWESARRLFDRCCELEVEISELGRAFAFGPTSGDMINVIQQEIILEAAMARPQYSIDGRIAAMRTIEKIVKQ